MASTTTDRRQGVSPNIGFKAPVQCASTAALAQPLQGLPVIDGYQTLSVDTTGYPTRVLYKDDANPMNNGLWDVSTGLWTRSIDSNGVYDLIFGSIFVVTGGTVNGGLMWQVSSANPNTPGFTAVTFKQFQNGGVPGLTFTQSGTAFTRSLQSKLQEMKSVRDAGATGLGIVDDSPAILAACTAWQDVVVPTGSYNINQNTVLPMTVLLQFHRGAILNIANGVTLTINGPIDAGVYQIFNCIGTGKVVFNKSQIAAGYPEWWGAVTNTGADCLAAIQACVAALSVTLLQAADYYLSATLVIALSHRVVQGPCSAYAWAAIGDCTRLVILSGAANAVQLGPNAQPANINLFIPGIVLRDVLVTRSVAPIIASAPSGVLNQFTLGALCDRVVSNEHSYDFQIAGAVDAHHSGCRAGRSTNGTGAGADFWYGFYLDGVAYNIGASGGNASIYFSECNASFQAGTASINANGIYLNGGFTDVYIFRPECDGCTVGINVQGNGLVGQNYGNIDLRIVEPSIDAFLTTGILFQNISKFGAISLQGGYAAPAGGSATAAACLYFNASLGAVSVTGFEEICSPNALVHGTLAINSANISTYGTEIIDSTAGAIALGTVTNCSFNDTITNNSSTGAFALQTSGVCACLKANIQASGKAAGLSFGYQLVGTTTTRSEFNCTGIDSGCVSGGSGNKLLNNGAQVTVVGAFGTNNYASGVMA